MATATEAVRRNNLVYEWLAFAAQVLIAVSVEVSDDLSRGLIAQHGTAIGNANALKIVSFESAHGFWVEPAWQSFFEHTHHIAFLTVTWAESTRVLNAIYVGGHVFVTLGTAFWMYFYRRRLFGFVRNIMILTNLFALFIYESFPVAPPRLTQGLTFHHHAFTFQDTVFGVYNAAGKLIGTQTGYNEFSAMPSVHIAWAVLVGACLVYCARVPLVRAFGIVYPLVMLVAVVVTGNHYLSDAAGAILVLVLATASAWGLEMYGRRYGWPWEHRIMACPIAVSSK